MAARRSKSRYRRQRTCRIVVPIGPAAAAAISDAATARATSITVVVLEALAAAGVHVNPKFFAPKLRMTTRFGCPRRKTTGYSVGATLPPETFRSLHRLVRKSGTRVAHFVRAALAQAGYPIGDDELIVNRRRAPARTPRRHYAQRP